MARRPVCGKVRGRGGRLTSTESEERYLWSGLSHAKRGSDRGDGRQARPNGVEHEPPSKTGLLQQTSETGLLRPTSKTGLLQQTSETGLLKATTSETGLLKTTIGLLQKTCETGVPQTNMKPGFCNKILKNSETGLLQPKNLKPGFWDSRFAKPGSCKCNF